ncbi:MAG: hypothetical protein EOO03_07025 [Chitinophagaceae bacterium]|nr:MAG: hypothetical protein EOO03_07025 [Chitinophagaceae bacterium]
MTCCFLKKQWVLFLSSPGIKINEVKKLSTLLLIFYSSIAALAQNVGIGNSNPAYPLDASGNIRLRSLGTAPGIWLNKTDNSELSHFAGNYDDTTYGISNTNGFRFYFDSKNGYMGLDQAAPRYPLSFSRSYGNKISLYSPTAQPGNHFGIGVQSGQFQFYTPTFLNSFVFGSGTSNTFSESVRITGTGQVGIGTVPISSAALDVGGTARAFYPPRVTSTQRTSIFQPQAGAMVFDTDKSLIYYFDGQAWVALGPADPGAIGIQTVTASDGQTYDRFGEEVAISGDYAIVSAPEKTVGTLSKVGGVYIYHKVNGRWLQETILAPPTPVANLGFGLRVAISGDHAIIASNSSQIFIYQRTGSNWNIVTTIVSSSLNKNVAIDANYALVTNGTDIKVYKRAGTNPTAWNLQTTLAPGSSGQLGAGLDISGDNFIVGDPKATAGGIAGAGKSYVYVLNGNTWTLQGTLFNTAPTNIGPQYFEESGASVAIQGDTAIVGAPVRNLSGNPIGEGAMYIFKRTGTTWTYVQMQRGNLSVPEESLGTTVAKSGAYLFASAPNFSDARTAFVYIYKYNSAGILTLQKLLKDNTEEGIGYKMDVSGNNYIIGNSAAQLATGKVTFGEIVN